MTEDRDQEQSMANRARDWYAQAEKDLEHARLSQSSGSHDWACFAAQQAAEKAVKALHLALGQEAWGHMVAGLLRELPLTVSADLVNRGMVLDNFYVPSRYPHGHPDGAPFEHYGPLQSGEAIDHADQIVAYVRAEMAGRGGG
jgi:HEPN domain-containing protein